MDTKVYGTTGNEIQIFLLTCSRMQLISFELAVTPSKLFCWNSARQFKTQPFLYAEIIRYMSPQKAYNNNSTHNLVLCIIHTQHNPSPDKNISTS